MKKLAILLISCFFCLSCTTLKPYERVFINDPAMQMSQTTGRNFGNYVLSIREGSTPVDATKSSGGCGCN